MEPYTELEQGLWIGSCPTTEAPRFVDAVLNLFGLTKYDRQAVQYREQRLLDLDVPDIDLLEDLAQWVDEQRGAGRTVLVHCEEGRNRSALVAGVYLIRHRGMNPSETIQLIRDKRGASALYNGAFVRFLATYGQDGGRDGSEGP